MPSSIQRYPKPADFQPEPTFSAGRRKGLPRCTAWSSRNGRQCGASPMRNKQKCAQHGGKSLAGIAAPSWVHGRSSKYLPARMLETYNASLHDKDLLALRHEISVVDARINDLFQRVDIGESGKLWLRSREVLLALRKALAAQDGKKVTEAIVELDDLIMHGSDDYAAWNEINVEIELRRRLTESERKRLTEMQQMISAEQAMMMMTAMATIVKENVTDRVILDRIQTAFIRIASKPDK